MSFILLPGPSHFFPIKLQVSSFRTWGQCLSKFLIDSPALGTFVILLQHPTVLYFIQNNVFNLYFTDSEPVAQ